MDLVDRTTSVDDDDAIGALFGFGEESVADALPEIVAMLLHSVKLALDPAGGGLDRHVEEKREIGLQAARDELANFPEPGDIKAAGMALIYDVGQQESVGDDSFAVGESRFDDLFDKLRSGGHVEQHFGHAADLKILSLKQKFADRFAQRRATRIAASNHVVPVRAEPLAEFFDLRRFAYAVDTIEAEEHAVLGFWRTRASRSS